MEVTLPELLDKKSILLLKLENLGESASNKAKNIKNNLDECNKAIEEFEKKGIEIRKQWSDKLYEYNKEAWVLYDKMAQEEKKENPDFLEMGKIYIGMQIANKKRVAVKNQITDLTGEGFKDVKVN
ncbi:hypothetical protein J4462_01110 [Candidatus Pacearchaeota archaeon]|nr:hypothetical protein [Candidatus Pacearchaeota archaeon]